MEYFTEYELEQIKSAWKASEVKGPVLISEKVMGRVFEHARELLRMVEQEKIRKANEQARAQTVFLPIDHAAQARANMAPGLPAKQPYESKITVARFGQETVSGYSKLLTDYVKEQHDRGYELVGVTSHNDLILLHFRRP